MSAAVEARTLSKVFGRNRAVDGIELSLTRGDCLAVFGPNGAGKTTLLRLMAGLLKPTSGSVRIHDVDVRRDARARAALGLISHQSMLYAPLTVFENVTFAARLHGVADPVAAATAALESMGVLGHVATPVRTLSRGLQQRVSLARALVHGPSVLLLDEPYTGLDESGAAALTAVLESLRGHGAPLVLVTHNLSEGLTLATQAAIMADGSFVRVERRAGAGFDVPRYATDYRALVGGGRAG